MNAWVGSSLWNVLKIKECRSRGIIERTSIIESTDNCMLMSVIVASCFSVSLGRSRSRSILFCEMRPVLEIFEAIVVTEDFPQPASSQEQNQVVKALDPDSH